eukprot:UN17942
MQRARLGRPSRYLEMSVKSTEKDLEAFEKSLASKNESLVKLKTRLKYSDKTSFFEGTTFFKGL